MTLQNLRYIIEVANCKSFSKAAQSLFMTQSALSTAVREIEAELGIQIFKRTNRGVDLTVDGEDCLRYCKEIVERSDYLATRYQKRNLLRTNFSVSCQHLPFAVRAFNELLSTLERDSYDVAIRETETGHILHDISTEKSSLGVIALLPDQLKLLTKSLYTHDLNFVQISQLRAYVFLRKRHPLANRATLTLDDLKPYPFVTYDQEAAPSFYSEECLFYKPLSKNIHVCDRATKMSLLRSTNSFSIGVDLPNFNQDIYFKRRNTEMVAIPYANQSEYICIGYLSKNGRILDKTAENYIQLLLKHIDLLKLPENRES